jgi:hypothetical protein
MRTNVQNPISVLIFYYQLISKGKVVVIKFYSFSPRNVTLQRIMMACSKSQKREHAAMRHAYPYKCQVSKISIFTKTVISHSMWHLSEYYINNIIKKHVWGVFPYIRSPFFFNLCVGALGTAATAGLLYQPRMIDDGDCGEIGGMKTGRGNRSTRRKPAQAPLS